jgi:TRAP-type C4-dicarboxylate transport system permease small subunit
MSSLAEAQRAAGGAEPLPPEPGFVQSIRKLDRGLALVEEVVLATFVAILLFVGVYGAYKRNIAPLSPFWSDELIRYAVFFIGLTGAALAAQSERLFNIDMFTRLLGVRGKLVLKILQAAFTIGVCWIFFSSSMVLRASLIGEKGELIPAEIAVLSLPIAMTLISIHMFLHILIAGYYLSTGKVPPEMAVPKVGH